MKIKKAKLVVVIILAGFCSLPAVALPPMGPPKSTLERDQLAIDFKYSYSEMDLELRGKTRDNLGSGWGVCDFTEYRVESLRTNMFLGSLDYGLCDNWDIFGHVGIADGKDEMVEALGCGRPGKKYRDFDGDYETAWGFGTRATICEDGELTWGGLFQITWSNPDDSGVRLRGDPNFSGDLELDFWQIQIAVGPTLQLDGLSIYGGPFLHFVQGDMDMDGTTVDSGVTQLVESRAEIREDSIFGGYGGLLWDVAEGVFWYTEAQFTGNAWGIGSGVVLIF